MTEHRQPAGEPFRSSDYAAAEAIRRSASSEPLTQQLAFVRVPQAQQDTSGSLRREEVLQEEMRRDAQRRENLRQHVAEAFTTRPLAVKPADLRHIHSFQVHGIIRFCDRCGASWVLVHRRFFIWGKYVWMWQRVRED